MSDTNGVEAAKPASPDKPNLWALKAAGALFVVGAIAFGAVSCQAGRPSVEQSGYERFAEGALEKLVVDPNPPAQPDTAFRDAADQPKRLQDFRGQVVVVNLWATWCAPCLTEMPTLGALQAAFKDKGLTVLAISVDRVSDRDSAIKELADLADGRLTFYGDPTYAIAYDLKAQGFPTTIVFGRDGREIARLAGGADWFSAEAKGLVEQALAEPAPS